MGGVRTKIAKCILNMERILEVCRQEDSRSIWGVRQGIGTQFWGLSRGAVKLKTSSSIQVQVQGRSV